MILHKSNKKKVPITTNIVNSYCKKKPPSPRDILILKIKNNYYQ